MRALAHVDSHPDTSIYYGDSIKLPSISPDDSISKPPKRTRSPARQKRIARTDENLRAADAKFGQPCTEVQEQKIACTDGQFCVRRIGC
jgi:hypothetical protein